MACSCHKKNGKTIQTEAHSADPYSQCLICAEKHFSAAFTEAKEFGYIDKNRSVIAGDLECASRHTMKSHANLAELFRQLRHSVQMREDDFIFEKWENVASLINQKIRDEIVTTNEGKIYIFSNVEYPESKKIDPAKEDLLVFLNKATSISFYKNHPHRMIYHRSPNESYGDVIEEVSNCYVFGNNGKNQIPDAFIKELKQSYDWNYDIEEGKVKSTTTGYMVAKYFKYKYPKNKIILVNFGYDVKNSTYRCPWHNWKFEAEELKEFDHIFTADTVKKKMLGEKMKVFLELSGWLGDNIYATAVVENLVRSGKVEMNVGTNRADFWAACPFLNREITRANADYVVREHNANSWKINTPHIIQGVLDSICSSINIDKIPMTIKKPSIYMNIPAGRLIEGKYVVINTGWQNSAPMKKWHDKYWEDLISSMPELRFVQMGQSKNHAKPIPGTVNMIDKTDLTRLIQLVRDAACVISPPSGVIHIAGALNVPFISLAGGREPETLVAYPSGKVISSVGLLDCCKKGGCHCHGYGCKNLHKISENDIAGECMKMITPENVAKELTKFL